MKKIVLLTIVMFLCVVSETFAKNSYSVDYSIGQDIIFFDSDTLKFPHQTIGISVFTDNVPNLYLSVGYENVLEKYTGNKKETDFSTNYGISSSIGYNFSYKRENQVFSFIPCLGFNSFNLKQNDYESVETCQLGIKTILGLGIEIKNFELRFSFVPQYSFFNYAYTREKKIDTVYIYDSAESSYKEKQFVYSSPYSEISAKAFQYQFTLSLLYKF